ncbi:hypothetical protein Barb6XT_02309 [Bacteroidales bacterium Barb6XT]|nr:hypothetical protein Barb6XT_02309 [Bacteroidales bacterium Barb6XT]
MGLKSLAPSGHLRNISNYYFSTVKLDIVTINYMYKKPIVTVSEVTAIIGKSIQTAYNLITDMEKAGIIKEITGSQRNRLFLFKKYMDLFG